MSIIKFPDKSELLKLRENGRSEKAPAKKNKALQNPSKEEVLLLKLADVIDSAILDAVLSRQLPAAEVAAIVAHRLGHLLLAMSKMPETEELDMDMLRDHLFEIIRRESRDPEADLRKPS